MMNNEPVSNSDINAFFYHVTRQDYQDVYQAVSVMKQWEVPYSRITSASMFVITDDGVDMKDVDITQCAYEVVLDDISIELTNSIGEDNESLLRKYIVIERNRMHCSYKVVENRYWLKWIARSPKVPERVRAFLRYEVMIDEVAP